MFPRRINLTLTLLALAAFALGCNVSFTTANISSLKIAKDEEGKSEASTFGPGDKIFAIAQISNSPDTYKVQFRMLFDSVQGQKSGELVPGIEKTLDVEGSRPAYFGVTPPPGGFPNGRYRVEVTMTDKNGKQIDKKEAGFNVTGFTATTPPTQPPASAEEQGEDEQTESKEP